MNSVTKTDNIPLLKAKKQQKSPFQSTWQTKFLLFQKNAYISSLFESNLLSLRTENYKIDIKMKVETTLKSIYQIIKF